MKTVRNRQANSPEVEKASPTLAPPCPTQPIKVNELLKPSVHSPRRKVQRHSPDRLLRQKLVLPGDVIVSAEKHKGRLVVRVESPEG
jgi:hypothetical protein